MTAHAKLSASGSERWMSCPGSIRLIDSLNLPYTSSLAADEGTAAHAFAAKSLLCDISPFSMLGTIETVNGRKYKLTDEMAEHITLYRNYIRTTLEHLNHSDLYIEKKFSLNWLRTDMWGTNDACISQILGELVVIDFKYGSGVLVEVKDNTQLLYYALGALNNLQDDNSCIRLAIVQPRIYHEDGPIREWIITKDYLLNWGYELGIAVDRTLDEDPALIVGDHCKWCRANAMCPQLEKQVMHNVSIEFPSENPNKAALAIDLNRALLAVPIVENWCKSVKETALQWLQLGNGLDDFKLVAKKANRQWKDEEITKSSLQALNIAPKDYMNAPKLKSPTQIDLYCKTRGIDKKLVSTLYHKPDTGESVVLNSDPRAEVAPSIIKEFLT